MEDDAALAREVRAAREVEKRVLDALRQDGTFDALRRRLVEEASAKQVPPPRSVRLEICNL